MKSKLKTAVVFILVLSVSLGLYYRFRWPLIELGYIKTITEKMELMRPVVSRIKTDTPGESLKKFFDELSSHDRALAAIAVADPAGNMKQIVKNDSMIHSGKMVDSLMLDIKGNAGISHQTGVTGRYYVFPLSTGSIRFIAVYVFRPGKALTMRIALELLLVLAVSIMAAAGVSAAERRRNQPQGDKQPVLQKTFSPQVNTKSAHTDKTVKKSGKKTQPDNQPATNIDESELFATKYTRGPSITAEAAAKDNAGTSAVGNALNSRVFDLFKKIYRELSPESVTLYIKKTGDRLSKSYELRGKTFLRVDAPVFESILIPELAEASRPGAHITGNGMKIRIPLFDDEMLVGLIEIILKESATALDISRIQNEVRTTSRQIREFIVINNVILDSETGYYSSSYLTIKLGEQIYSAMKHGSGFCFMVADIFGARDIDSEQKKAMMKILLPVARKATGDRYELFNSGYRIAVIIDHADRNDAERIRRTLEGDISRYRIKLAEGRIIRLTPVIEFTVSSEAESLKDILQETLDKTEKVAVTV